MTAKDRAVKMRSATLFFLPVETRVPLKFGAETLTRVSCARVKVCVEGSRGRCAVGWGETPLSVQWVWPSATPYSEREQALMSFTSSLAEIWAAFPECGHALDLGHAFINGPLKDHVAAFNRKLPAELQLPWLAALVSFSAYDIALHDAYGNLHGVPVYETYNREWMTSDLSELLEPAEGSQVSFAGRYPSDYLALQAPRKLTAWHLVGGMDLLEDAERTGAEPDDGYPVTLREWIRRDGLRCLKIKLRGNDADWDYDRTVRVGRIGIELGVDWLSTDFNCTVQDPSYVYIGPIDEGGTAHLWNDTICRATLSV